MRLNTTALDASKSIMSPLMSCGLFTRLMASLTNIPVTIQINTTLNSATIISNRKYPKVNSAVFGFCPTRIAIRDRMKLIRSVNRCEASDKIALLCIYEFE